MAQVFVAVVLALLAMPMAHADVCILSSSGDMVEDYLRTFAQIRQSGERVIIDGPCLSACTLVLSTIPKKRICVTSRAVLGFHAARWVDPRTGRMSRAPEATRIVTQSYPPGVVRGLRSGAGLRGRSFISTGGSSGLCIDGARRLEVVSSHEWSQAQRGADRSPCFSVSGGTRAMSANGSIGVLLLPLLFGPCGWRSMRKHRAASGA